MCQKRPSVLKNSFVPLFEPLNEAKNPIFMVFSTRFLGVSVPFRTTDRSEGDFFNSLERL